MDEPGMTGQPAGLYIAVVRRGEMAVFRSLLRSLEAQPGPAQVIWDRRAAERRKARSRGSLERRRGDRRTPPPQTWSRRGFFYAPCRPGTLGR
jgi:hypothetical protein